MSMEVIKKSSEDTAPFYSGEKEVKKSPSFAMLCLASDHLEQLIQAAEKDHCSFGDQKSGVQPGQMSSPEEDQIEFNQKSIFEAAGKMTQLQTEESSSLAEELKNELAVMQAQLEVMESMAAFWEKFSKDWAAFMKNTSDQAAFDKVMQDLEEEAQGDPDLLKDIKNLEKGYTDSKNKEKEWKKHDFFYHLFHGMPVTDPHYFKKFIGSHLKNIESDAEKSVGSNMVFANPFSNGQEAFQTKIRRLFKTVEILMNIVAILDGSGKSSQAAMFDMEALLMSLEQLQINTNTEKSQQQQQISQATAENLQNNLKKISADLKKLAERHCHGVLGFFKSLGKLVGHAFEALGQLVAAGVLEDIGQHKLASNLMESNKKLGEEMLANPAFKILGEIAMVVMIVVSAASGNEALAAVMLGVFLMSVTGNMQKLTNWVADKLGGDKVLADVLVMLIVTALSAGAGAAEAAVSVGEEAATEAAVTAGEEVTSQSSAMIRAEAGAAPGDPEPMQMEDLSQARIAQNEVNDVAEEIDEPAQDQVSPKKGISALKRAASMGAFGLGSTLGSSTLVLDILKAKGKEDNKTLAIILELVQTIVAAVTASIGGFTAMAQSAGTTVEAAESSAINLGQLGVRMNMASNLTSAMASGANGGETILRGLLMEAITENKANVALDEATEHGIDSMVKQTGEELKHIVKGYEELIATAFKTPAEVVNAELQALIQG